MVRDYAPLLKQAITEAKAAGLAAQATDLEQRTLLAVFTTSSEMLQEQGLAIARFLQANGDALPRRTKAKFKACLNETYLVYAGWRSLVARIRRPRSLAPEEWK